MTVTAQTVVAVVETKIEASGQAASNTVSKWCSAHWRNILSEFVATLLLVLLGCMATIPTETGEPQSPLIGPLGFGFVVSVNVQTFGHISGAYMNPVITLAAVIWGSYSYVVGIAYVIAQCAGAIVGYGILTTVTPMNAIEAGVCLTLPHPSYSMYQAIIVEVFCTAALTLINCGVWDSRNAHKQDSSPIKFGLAVAGLSFAGGQLTGCSMNPARSLGPALWTGNWTAHWVYWVGPFIGALIPTLLFKYIWLKDNE